MSEPALSIKVKVPWLRKPVLLSSINFLPNEQFSADYTSEDKKMGWYYYPTKFELLEVSDRAALDKLLSQLHEPAKK